MNHFDLLETKRKHVRRYSVNKIPPIELIQKALWKAWKTSPSKNNAMAYQVLVWGPDKKIEKEAIHSLCVKNHKHADCLNLYFLYLLFYLVHKSHIYQLF